MTVIETLCEIHGNVLKVSPIHYRRDKSLHRIDYYSWHSYWVMIYRFVQTNSSFD